MPNLGVHGAHATPHNQGGCKHPARGARSQGDHQRREFGGGDPEQGMGGQPVVQHVANGVVPGAEDLGIEVPDQAEQEGACDRRPNGRGLQREAVEGFFQKEKHADHGDGDQSHDDSHQGEQPEFLHADQGERGRWEQRRPTAEVHGDGGGHDGGNRHGDEGARAKFEKEKFDGHQDSRQGRDKRGGHAGGGAGGQQHAPLVGREVGELRENRAEGRSRLDDGTFRAERSTGADGERRGQGLEDAHAHAHLAFADQHGLHGFRNAVALQGRLPKVDHDADQQAANGRDQDHPRAQMVMDREGHGE